MEEILRSKIERLFLMERVRADWIELYGREKDIDLRLRDDIENLNFEIEETLQEYPLGR